MATLVLTVIGDDRPGLVDALASRITAHGGNWDRTMDLTENGDSVDNGLAWVLGAAVDWGTVGAGVAFTLALIHLALAERPGLEWPLMLAAVAIGVTVDTLHAAAGVLDFRGHEAGMLAPH